MRNAKKITVQKQKAAAAPLKPAWMLRLENRKGLAVSLEVYARRMTIRQIHQITALYMDCERSRRAIPPWLERMAQAANSEEFRRVIAKKASLKKASSAARLRRRKQGR